MVKKHLSIKFFLVSLAAMLVFLTSCLYQTPIRIGFAAQLTGKQADPGIHLRNGVELAVEEINAAGGINDRKIELLVEDDLGTPQGAKDAETKIIDQGVVAVIGHFTSDQTLAGYEVAEKRGVLLFSATASTSVMTGLNDLFYRTVASTDAMGSGFATYIYRDKKINSIAVIFDEDNKSYSEPLANAFTATFTKLGGNITYTEKFSSSRSPDYSQSVTMMKDSAAKAVFIIASPNDTALITQTIALQNWAPELFTSSWAQGELLYQTGGKTIEGMETIVGFDVNDATPELDKFKEDYLKRYGVTPGFTAMEGYETMQLLARGLEKTGGSAINLGNALIGIQDYMGLTGPVMLDAYGDALRVLSIQKIIDGKFVTIKKLDMTEK